MFEFLLTDPFQAQPPVTPMAATYGKVIESFTCMLISDVLVGVKDRRDNCLDKSLQKS